MFRKRRTENGEQTTEAGRDYHEVTASWGIDGARYVSSRCDQVDWSCWTNLLPLAQAVWRNERRSIGGTEASPEGEWTAQKVRVWFDARQIDLEGSRKGKLLSPARRRACINHVRSQFKVSERRAVMAKFNLSITSQFNLMQPLFLWQIFWLNILFLFNFMYLKNFTSLVF